MLLLHVEGTFKRIYCSFLFVANVREKKKKKKKKKGKTHAILNVKLWGDCDHFVVFCFVSFESLKNNVPVTIITTGRNFSFFNCQTGKENYRQILTKTHTKKLNTRGLWQPSFSKAHHFDSPNCSNSEKKHSNT